VYAAGDDERKDHAPAGQEPAQSAKGVGEIVDLRPAHPAPLTCVPMEDRLAHSTAFSPSGIGRVCPSPDFHPSRKV